ncbi:FUSC family protein [Streptomyces sp. NPDC090022]|uniref:FUSC family protein n=1 Tax=Streptomyces sp. NPDC090022 TaxID=3365920 RepID=UPI00380F596A
MGADRGRTGLRGTGAYAAAGRRSARVTLAACAGFYLFRYGLDQRTAATYALFGAVSMAGLSRIPGTGRQRAAVLVRLLPLAWFLIAAGTLLAVHTWTAVLGMLVIGFTLAFAAAAGPRPAGAGPGLQLLYILPSFPPYAPDTLDERLIGATVGIGLLIAAEAFLFPDPPTVPYREIAARAAGTAARCAAAADTAPYTVGGALLDEAQRVSQSLRPSQVAEADRPAGPSLRERALAHTGLATRTLLNRLTRLPAAPAAPGQHGQPVADAGPDLLRSVGRVCEEVAAQLRGAGPGRPRKRPEPDPGPQSDPGPESEHHSARTRLAQDRAAAAGTDAGDPDTLRRRAALIEVADAALAMGTGADLAVRGRAAGKELVDTGRFWYAHHTAPALWWYRLQGHAAGRSVFFQNAVRLGLALAAARTVAGLDTLPHGFWAMLATLSLTRTTVTETRTSIRQALTGTLIGALAAGTVLALGGTDLLFYGIVLPPLMLFTFTVGPVRGIGWAQALFTLVVALVFAQLAPATWRLAEVRLLDVLIGSAIGAVFGLLAWPRGAHDELGRSVAVLLRGAAEVVVATAAALAAGGTRQTGPQPGHGSLQHSLAMAESAFAQYQSEGVRPADDADRPAVDWQNALMTAHHTLWGARRLLEPAPGSPATAPPLGTAEAEAVLRLGDRVAGRMLVASAHLDPGDDTPKAPVGPRPPAPPPPEPPGAPATYYAAVSWLESLLADLDRVTAGASATAPPPTRVPTPDRP